MCTLENNTQSCRLDQSLKEENNFVMEQYLLKKKSVEQTFDRSVDIRTIMLSLSKVLMQDFHYIYIKNKYGNKAGMLPTDN